MTGITLHEGDNRVALRRMIEAGEFVDSVVCDPPYGLVSVRKRFGGKGAAPAKFGTDGAFARQSRGFMGKQWDGTGIERDPEFWSLVWQVMKPGAYIIAFSSSRTYGYMQVAMEAAGFITHPMFGWVQNQGFPKGHQVKYCECHGTERPQSSEQQTQQLRIVADQRGPQAGRSWSICAGCGKPDFYEGDTTPLNERMHGWKTGTQSLKPALEPVYFGQKPFSEKTGAANVLKHGVGAVNIEACRVAWGGDKPSQDEWNRMGSSGASTGGGRIGQISDGQKNAYAAGLIKVPDGRYPANLIHDGSPEVAALFPQSGGQIARSSSSSETRKTANVYGDMARGAPGTEMDPRSDSGSAARFFNSFPHEGPILCHPKAGKADRAGSSHATVKPIALMQHFIRLVTPPGGTVLDPFAGSGTTGQAALNEGMACILMEAESEYVSDIRRRFDLPCPTIHQYSEFDDILGGDAPTIEIEDVLG